MFGMSRCRIAFIPVKVERRLEHYTLDQHLSLGRNIIVIANKLVPFRNCVDDIAEKNMLRIKEYLWQLTCNKKPQFLVYDIFVFSLSCSSKIKFVVSIYLVFKIRFRIYLFYDLISTGILWTRLLQWDTFHFKLSMKWDISRYFFHSSSQFCHHLLFSLERLCIV